MNNCTQSFYRNYEFKVYLYIVPKSNVLNWWGTEECMKTVPLGRLSKYVCHTAKDTPLKSITYFCKLFPRYWFLIYANEISIWISHTSTNQDSFEIQNIKNIKYQNDVPLSINLNVRILLLTVKFNIFKVALRGITLSITCWIEVNSKIEWTVKYHRMFLR